MLPSWGVKVSGGIRYLSGTFYYRTIKLHVHKISLFLYPP
jgi:hypothetical protein